VNPDATECAWSYGLALASLDFPRGHARLPDGGRVVVGFDFNRTPLYGSPNPAFLVPPLESTGGAALRAEQLFLRHVPTMPDGNCATMTGRLGAAAVRDGSVTMLELPPFLPPPDPGLLPDAGLHTRVTLIPLDPFAECGSVTAEKIYAVATGMLEPQSGNALPGEVSAPVLPHNALKGLLLGRVDRDLAGGAAYQDRWWRIYAPPGAVSISIPPEVSPFSSGQEVWVTPWSASFNTPFDYDLFVPDRVLGPKAAYSEDSWALIVP
jgi:hypothetical protein